VRYLSLFSGIEAASVAWEPLGWTPVAFAEVDPHASAVLAHRWPGVPNLGDVAGIDGGTLERLGRIDLLVFGWPCFPAETLVITDCGLLTIDEFGLGDLLITVML
jgi:site-specific DNA-cytosine methylase